MLLHQNKTFESYYFLASTVVGLCPQLNFLTAFGTDGDQTLGNAFATQFCDASHHLCFLYVKDRIKVKLHDLRVNTECAKCFVNDVFGQVLISSVDLLIVIQKPYLMRNFVS